MNPELYRPEPLPEELELKKLNINVKFPDVKTQVDFLFVRHETADDLPDDLSEQIAAHDVIMLEGVCWKEDALSAHQAISNGDTETLDSQLKQTDAFGKVLLTALAGSEKPIRYCDIPYTKRNREMIDRALGGMSFKGVFNFEAFIKRSNDQMVSLVKLGIFERDKYILRNLYPTLIEASSDLEIPADEPVRVLYIIGAVHQTVAHGIRKQISKQGLHDMHSVTEDYFWKATDFTQQSYIEFLAGNPLPEDIIIKSMIERRLADTSTPEVIDALLELDPVTAKNIYRHILINAGNLWADDGNETPEQILEINNAIDSFLAKADARTQ